jgi:hypothetical protein
MVTVIVQESFDIRNSGRKLVVRLFQPQQAKAEVWVCRFEVEHPINAALDVHGVSALQALALALKGLSATLYGSDLYRRGELGAFGEFGGYLGIPAPSSYSDFAPYEF